MVEIYDRQHVTYSPPSDTWEQKCVPKSYGNNNLSTMLHRKKNMIMCANCGGLGHIYRTCNHPTISYGFICYKTIGDKTMFLMVQRKDSLSYVEFMRGKYDLQNLQYIMKLFSHMIEEERDRMLSCDFDTLWKNMWCKDENDHTLNSKSFNKEYLEASEKFNRIKNGYFIKTNDNSVIHVNLEYIVANTVAEYSETEWGFPKGRRNVNENDLTCALREFKEETGYNPKCLSICYDIKPLEEVFSGTNKKRYKHVYYVAHINQYYDMMEWQPSCKEIKNVQWFSYEDAQDKIRGFNIERKELLKRLHQIVNNKKHTQSQQTPASRFYYQPPAYFSSYPYFPHYHLAR